jgi:hypothetical protein
MGRYLLLWKLDWAKIPISPQERGAGFNGLLEGVKEDIRKGLIKDWGSFVGELNGYAVAEGNEIEVGNTIQRYVPFVIFEVHPVMSAEQVGEVVKALTK